MCFDTPDTSSTDSLYQQIQQQQSTMQQQQQTINRLNEDARKKADVAKAKGRLLFTAGENNGVKLNQNQGGTIRKIFGNG